MTAITSRMGRKTTFAYNAFGQMTNATDALGIVTEYIYDAATRRLTQVKRDGQAIAAAYTYDAIGRVKTATDATGATLTYTYNTLNHVTAVTYPDGKADTYAYSSCCPRMVDRVTGRDGVTTAFEYDGLKRLISRADPLGVTRFGYDPNGNLTTLTDPAKQVTTFAYNLDDLMISKTYQDGSKTQWAHDAKGLRQFTNARGATATYAYDANGNLTGIDYSDATPDVTFGYDGYDRLTAMQDGIGAWSYGYDADSELTSVDGPWENDTLTYAYDALGRRIGLTPQIGAALTYLHDRLSRLTTVRLGAAADAPAYVYAYAGANPLVQSLTRPNGSVTTYQYDALARLREIKTTTSGGAILSRHHLSYNAAGDRSEETITGSAIVPIPALTPKTSQESVNAVNQLTGRTAPQQAFAYDADGNLTKGYTKDGLPFTAAYDAENRLTALTYTDSAGTTWTTHYAHSGDGLLAKITIVENGGVYGETRFVRDGGLELQQRAETNSVTREFAWGLHLGGGIGGLLNMRYRGQDYSYVYDAGGNVEIVLDRTQGVYAAYRYDPFGTLLAKRGATQPFGFSTKQTDRATGLVYFGYRFYAPHLGRWTSRDPLGEDGGLNLYAYVANNPVNWVDPWGLDIDNTEGICSVFYKDEKTTEVHELPAKQKYIGYHDGVIEPKTGDVYKTGGREKWHFQDNVRVDKDGKLHGVIPFLGGKKGDPFRNQHDDWKRLFEKSDEIKKGISHGASGEW